MTTPAGIKKSAYGKPVRPHVVVTGTPIDGFTFYGPFKSAQDAEVWANASAEINYVWWRAPLCKPDKML